MKAPKIVSYLAPGALMLTCLAGGWPMTAHAYLPDARTATQLVVSPEYKEGELLVKFKNTVYQMPSMAVGVNAVPEVDYFESIHVPSGNSRALAEDPWQIARLKPGSNTLSVKEQLARHPDVESVELNYRVTVAQIPNDPRFSEQWSVHNIGQTGGTFDADIDAPEAWDHTTGSNHVVVAVIDTGVDYTHEDLRSNMWTNTREIPGNGFDDDGNGYVDDVYGYDFFNNDSDPQDDYGHGTHVAGIIAATGNNGVGITGVSWSAKIMAVKFIGASGYGFISDAVRAIRYATTMGAKLMNNSWGGGDYSPALYDAISEANSASVLFVTSAGNEGINTDFNIRFPSGYDVPNVVSVAATDHRDNKASWSNYGATSVELGAPGVNILSTTPRGGCALCDPTGYGYMSGTSMAAPQVAGVAALMLSQASWSPAELKQRLMDSVDALPSLARLTVSGGRLNANRAVRGLTPQLPDLVLGNLSGPISVKAGSFINLNTRLDNLGRVTAPSVLTLFALSTDPIITWADMWLGCCYFTDLAPGNSVNISSAFGISKDIAPGTYYIGALVDFIHMVDELDDNNNSRLIQIEVLAP